MRAIFHLMIDRLGLGRSLTFSIGHFSCADELPGLVVAETNPLGGRANTQIFVQESPLGIGGSGTDPDKAHELLSGGYPGTAIIRGSDVGGMHIDTVRGYPAFQVMYVKE